MKILLTGFEPWGDVARNPSGEVAAALGGHVLPVDFARAARELRRLIRTEKPDAVLMLGLAVSRPEFNVEIVALNLDQGGVRRRGPLARETRLPVDRILQCLHRCKIPARRSHHAGTFVCNHVFYVGLSSTKVPCGFVHVPPFTSMELPRQLRAVEAILKALGGARGAARPSARRRAPSPRASEA